MSEEVMYRANNRLRISGNEVGPGELFPGSLIASKRSAYILQGLGKIVEVKIIREDSSVATLDEDEVEEAEEDGVELYKSEKRRKRPGKT